MNDETLPGEPRAAPAPAHLPEAPGEASTLAVAELAAALGVRVARRPWRRRRLGLGELRNVELALARAGCLPVGGQAVPRALDARIVVVRPARPEDSWRRRVRRLTFIAIARFVAVVGFVSAAIGIWHVAFPPGPEPARLDGELNFAVMPFRSAGTRSGADRSATAAAAVAQTIARSLKATLAGRDPNVVVDARAFDLDGSQPAQLAARVDADAVIFGEVATADGEAVVTPYVYVAPRKLLRVSELAGVFRLGDRVRLPVALGESAPAAGQLRRIVVARGQGLAELLDAVGYYAADDFAAAAAHLRAAAAAPAWSGPRERAVLDLLLGNLAAKLARGSSPRHARAGAWYRAALAQAPGFARARFGLAEIAFHDAHGACTARTADADGLKQALHDFRAVLDATWQPPQVAERRQLQMKVRFGAGRVYLCQSQAGLLARWERARRELEPVSRAYPRDPLLRDEAAEASADLAIVELPRRGQQGARTAYAAARTDYTRAIRLTRDPAAVAALYVNRAYVEARLGLRRAAAVDRGRAAAHGGSDDCVRPLAGCEQISPAVPAGD